MTILLEPTLNQNHDDVAREIEQQVESVTYVETEGAECTRVDFTGEMSIWLTTLNTGQIELSGTVTRRLHTEIGRYLNHRAQ